MSSITNQSQASSGIKCSLCNTIVPILEWQHHQIRHQIHALNNTKFGRNIQKKVDDNEKDLAIGSDESSGGGSRGSTPQLLTGTHTMIGSDQGIDGVPIRKRGRPRRKDWLNLKDCADTLISI